MFRKVIGAPQLQQMIRQSVVHLECLELLQASLLQHAQGNAVSIEFVPELKSRACPAGYFW